MIGTELTLAARFADPVSGCRKTIQSLNVLIAIIVSSNVSPFVALENLTLFIGITDPPFLVMAL